MALTDNQRKAASSLERALNRVGAAGLSGGVYDGTFIIYPSDNDRFDVIEEVCGGNEENGVSLHTPKIQLDGGAGV